MNGPQVVNEPKPAAGTPRVTVLMPTCNQRHFIARAIRSVLGQSLQDWVLLILDDGSPDDTFGIVQPYLSDSRISYHRWEPNQGLGAALNCGLDLAVSPLIAYLPSDDVLYPGHLESLVAALEATPEAVLAYSGVRHHYNRYTETVVDGHGLQLAQVAHRKTSERWIERRELVTDDLDRMFWSKLKPHGTFLATGGITCEWVDHPAQRHKLLREPEGGINPYRLRFRISHPLRFHSTAGNAIDEVAQYRQFRERPDTPLARDGLKIVLVGELAYNAERVLALEERGHKLYGLWMKDPHWYNTVGPLPFGHVEDLPDSDWQQALRRIKPDLIYGLLNWQAVPFAHHVLRNNPGIPFAWHFKEGPFICLEKGTWPELVDLHSESQGQIYSSPEMETWFRTVVPGTADSGTALVLDGDLPKRDWFRGERVPLLSESDNEFHTVVPGRPIGLHPETVAALAQAGIHLHFYGDFTHSQWLRWIEKARALAPRHLHLHPQVNQSDWLHEFSQYDAGWLHYFRSENQGDISRSNWDDLNYPARLATLAVSGLPVLQRKNSGAIVATQNLVKDLDIGLFFETMAELGEQLGNRERMKEIRDNVWRQRSFFTFDHHADRLVAFFREVIGR